MGIEPTRRVQQSCVQRAARSAVQCSAVRAGWLDVSGDGAAGWEVRQA